MRFVGIYRLFSIIHFRNESKLPGNDFSFFIEIHTAVIIWSVVQIALIKEFTRIHTRHLYRHTIQFIC